MLRILKDSWKFDVLPEVCLMPTFFFFGELALHEAFLKANCPSQLRTYWTYISWQWSRMGQKSAFSTERPQGPSQTVLDGRGGDTEMLLAT